MGFVETQGAGARRCLQAAAFCPCHEHSGQTRCRGQSLAIAGATLNNKRIAGSLSIVSQGVKRGEGIAGPLRKSGEFPPLAAHLLSVGEETGRLDSMFARMADIYESDTRTAIKRFTALFEPLVILIMGIIVGALILSMLLAITSMNEVVI
ncbi:MAG: type II secretion system F family protein [Bryobacteraceae bacterium]